MTKVFFPLSRDKTSLLYGDSAADADGYVNQYGLSRKVPLPVLFSAFNL
jgi:hypothetical protein